MIHIFDTSSFRVLEHYYPGRFPSLWKLLDEAAEVGGLISVREVFNELEFLARAKIPNVCQHFGVQCTDVEGFMTARGWQF